MDDYTRKMALQYCIRAQELAVRAVHCFDSKVLMLINLAIQLLGMPTNPGNQQTLRKVTESVIALAWRAQGSHVRLMRSKSRSESDHAKAQRLWIASNILEAVYYATMAAYSEIVNPRDEDVDPTTPQEEIDMHWTEEAIREYREERRDDMNRECPLLLAEAKSCLG